MEVTLVNEAVVRAQIRAFLQKFIANHALSDDEDIFATGFVNSLFAMQLVMFIEQTFDMTVGDEDLSIDNFRSIDVIARLVLRNTM
ncbi:MAG: acyl carrier protein [Oscillochloris sp.]|nr:acyl carrier protein [Oscillochloris sp.]